MFYKVYCFFLMFVMVDLDGNCVILERSDGVVGELGFGVLGVLLGLFFIDCGI